MADSIMAGAETLVNVSTIGDQYGPVTATLENGRYVIAWTDETGSGSTVMRLVKARLFEADGTPVGGEIRVDVVSDPASSASSITALAGGGFVIGWFDGAGVTNANARVFAADGSAVSGQLVLQSPGAQQEINPELAGLTNGGFVAVWQAFGDNPGVTGDAGTFGQRYGASGVAIGDPFLVNTRVESYQTQARVVGLSTGGFVVAWTDFNPAADGNQGATRAQLFGADGAKIGGEIAVNATTVGSQWASDITALAGGGFAVHYTNFTRGGGESARSSLVQRFDDNGIKVGAEVDLGAPAGRFEQLGDGSFIHAYQSQDPAAGFVRRYDTTLTPIGDAEMIVGTGPGLEEVGDVTATATGFVVAYTTTDPAVDGDGTAVVMRRYVGVSTSPSTGDDVITAPSDADYAVSGGLGDDSITGGAGDDELFGAAGDDRLFGGLGADLLLGGVGDDFLSAGGGLDRLFGGFGLDRLLAGAGFDRMTGGADADVFAFAAAELTNIARQIDARILDFSSADGDRIDLSAIDAVAGGGDNAFTFIGANRFSGVAGELQAFVRGALTFIQGDTDGDRVADLVIRFDGAPVLAGTDIML